MLDTFTKHASALASWRKARIELLHGRLRTDGSALSAIYAGNGDNAEYIASLLFEEVTSRTRLSEVSPLSLAGGIAAANEHFDLMICERAPLWAEVGGALGDVRLPAWVSQEVALSGSTATRWQVGRHLEREVARHIRRHGYRLVMSDSQADKAEFFENFYQPYIRSRHGTNAITADQRKFTAVASGAALAKLFSGDVWTAGMLLKRSGSALRLGWFGAGVDPPAPGASETLDMLCIQAAMQRGISHVNFGHSRPSLRDGVLRYKSKFGAQPVMTRYPQTVIELQIHSDRQALRDWLTNQQFLCMQQRHLAVAGYSATGKHLEFRPLPTASSR